MCFLPRFFLAQAAHFSAAFKEPGSPVRKNRKPTQLMADDTTKISSPCKAATAATEPLLNEREIRAAAGILFVMLFTALMFVFFRRNFSLVKYTVVIFLADFLVRIFITPALAPTLVIGRLIVGRQPPEWVGAPAKKFAWAIGLALSGAMFVSLVVLNTYSLLTVVACFACLTFLFFETAFGICLGCLVYPLFSRQPGQRCAGELCSPAAKSAGQNLSPKQQMVLFGFVLSLFATIVFFNERFQQPPSKWAITKPVLASGHSN